MSSCVKNEKVKTFDLRTPRMFRDEDISSYLAKIKTLREFKNIGITTEKAFFLAGIKTPKQFIKLGWKKTFTKICRTNSKHCNAFLAYALIGALDNTEWNALSAENKKEAQELAKLLRNKFK